MVALRPRTRFQGSLGTGGATVPRKAKPWFRSQTGWWMAVVGGVRHKLCKGRENKDEARRRLREILTLRDLNPCLKAGPLTVAAVIEKFLEHAAKVYAERSLYERRIILQSFAEAPGEEQP